MQLMSKPEGLTSFYILVNTNWGLQVYFRCKRKYHRAIPIKKEFQSLRIWIYLRINFYPIMYITQISGFKNVTTTSK